MHADVPPLALDRAAAEAAAEAALTARGVTLGREWRRFSMVRTACWCLEGSATGAPAA